MERDYKNNICLIGKDIEHIKAKLDLIKDDNKDKIQNLWNIISFEKRNGEDMNSIFDGVVSSLKEQNKKYSMKTYSYTIIYSLEKFNAEQERHLKALLNQIIKICKTYFNQPFLILLSEDELNKKKVLDFFNKEEIRNIGIDPRNISSFVSPLNSNNENGKMIKLKIFKIFSYFYEFGDKFELKNVPFILYKRTKEKYYSINMLILGRTQVGKSTFINTLLGEKKAKEGGRGFSITKNQLTYHLDDIPLEINDIEGFTGEKTINEVINKIKKMQNKLGEKELHIVIYILNYDATTYFNDNEYLIFKQLTEKLDNTQFLFVCTKSKENIEDEKIEEIQESFVQMIQRGIEETKSDANIINQLKFLYYCQKKDFNYEEINENITKEKFEELNFFEKFELKFKNTPDNELIDEMTKKILEKDESLLFVNLIKDKDHNRIFGMEKVSKKIRDALKYIKANNMKFINDDMKINEEQKNRLKRKIECLKKKINENEENNINNYIDPDINTHIRKSNEEAQSLLNKSNNELENIDNTDKDFKELLDCIAQEKVDNAKKYAEKLTKTKMRMVKDKVKTTGRIGKACLIGLIPIYDLFAQRDMKKDIQKEIADELNDDLIDLDGNNLKISEEEQSFTDIENFKKDTSDIPTDIIKTIAKTGGWALFFLSKVLKIGGVVIGSLVGSVVSGIVINYDINKYL
jgi:GTP-binding protein EngB required for normal cell division